MIKPDWAKPLLKEEPNPEFKEEIKGPNVIEGILTPQQVQDLNKIGYNAYWFPNHPSKDVYKEGTRHLSGRMIDNFNFIFVDMDSKDCIYKTVDDFLNKLREFPLKPTMTVKSGHGVHAYWKIDNLSREEYILAQFAFLRYFNTDESVWTVLQLMRVPGSINTKVHGEFRQTEMESDLSCGQSYQFSQIPKDVFSDIKPEDQQKAQNHLDKLDGKIEVKVLENVNFDELPESFYDLMEKHDNIKALFNDPIGTWGDRSRADMKLVNELFNKKLPKKDALAVLANTQKGLSKGSYRYEYAQMTVDKAYVDRTKNKFKNVAQKIRCGETTKERELVKGPYYMDCLINGWAKSNVLGLVGGSGVGKTATTLENFKHMIENNKDENDDIYVFFTLEMPENEIIERWVALE
jgi:hypothetical protein